MLRDDALPGSERLADLAAEFEAGTGMPCKVAVTGGSKRDLGTDGRLTFYRVTQEALTNIRKHAHADRVEIRLAEEEVAACGPTGHLHGCKAPEPANLCSPLTSRADNEERAESAIRSLTLQSNHHAAS